ncbi:MAG: type I restriction endonuclease subunit R [Lutibacter sp.]
MKFNEDSRVKIPSILHLTRLGYTYVSLKNATWNEDTNLFTAIFLKSITKINVGLTKDDANRLLDEVTLLLDNEDLGKAFYERLTEKSGVKLIDFENFEKNTFNVVTELTYKKDEDEFRPDIILLINGMPLVFIEVKKPNNKDGILAERDRINTRFQNKKFRKFVNMTQLMVFSNNMEYNDGSPSPIEGAFYASPSYYKPNFNYFREEEKLDLTTLLSEEDDVIENEVLKDTNLVGIKFSPEFLTNKDPDTPTNRICTSMFSKERLSFILQYAIAYVNEKNGIEKHIMRYPQLFATKAIEKKLNEGVRKGIIWHTQGSGKTALAYYNVKFLTDYYQKENVVPKFYFIVDRLDLLIQAGREFKSRGLIVHNVNSRDEFARTIKSTKAVENNSGKAEITVVNIQKFKDDPDVIRNTDYNLSLQRIYFLDEVHRSYNPKGSFLANLKDSDPNSIKIGLTGTPLLGDDFNSKSLFGNYIHKYYYNKSIADGYTLRLIREEIETSYKLTLEKALEEIQILKGDADKKVVYSHHKFVEPMLDYIVSDFEKSRISMNDATIGAMVVCDSSNQAKMMFEIFTSKYAIKENSNFEKMPLAAEPKSSYGDQKKKNVKVTRAALILHDIGTKQERKDWVEDFKEGKIDLLFVYNMLLTGFDAKRLKKLYIGRVIKSHNLLQTLTRVNRTYNDFKYGYVVDFADIQSEFDKTNKAYFDELQEELGDEMQYYSDLFLSQEEIETQVKEIKDALFYFDTKNAEIFSKQITQISDPKQMLEIVKALNNAKSLYNLIRLSGHYDLLEKLDFRKLTVLSTEANNHLALLNTKEALENNVDTTNILNIALEDVLFAFTKVKEEEMILADQLKNILQRTREGLANNFDQKDPVFISLKEELERLFKKKNLSEVTKEEMEANIIALEAIYSKAKELERKNELIKAKYENDAKYARIHKRLMEKDPLTDSEQKLFEVLSEIKEKVDNQILQNAKILENESFVDKMIARLVIVEFKKKNIPLDLDKSKRIINLVAKEYTNEYHGRIA